LRRYRPCPVARQRIAPGSSGFACEAIAPVTHQVLAISQLRQVAQAASAGPEKRWFRHVSQFLYSSYGCRFFGPTHCWLTLQAIACHARAAAPGVQSEPLAYHQPQGWLTCAALIVTRSSSANVMSRFTGNVLTLTSDIVWQRNN